MGHAGEDWPSHGEIAFEDCRVPREHLLGAEGDGFAMAQARLGPGRIYHAMRWLGICERAFDIMCRRASMRELAPGELLAARESVQAWIAESRAEIDAARLLVLRAAWCMDQQGARAARVEISLIKFTAARALLNVIDRAIQVHGALGVSDDLLLSTFYRNERAARIYDGPDEVHKRVVARHILKDYGVTLP
jgi:alkylation response protein AidB-like acyl-CoA dehydrogenase